GRDTPTRLTSRRFRCIDGSPGRRTAPCARPPDDDWCGQRDGRLTLTLPAPAGESQRAAVASLLDRYALTWELT
ncbi:MAG TPA: hypothetical protein VHN80_23200, partial [Kineosporiaceae bacterium]|nr:hypothetical protein [Kineosporiaceae bacterium]